MRCKEVLTRISGIVSVLLLVAISFTCEETLPTYTPPKNVLALNVTTI
ncbi:MAG: hypothetical protein HYR76_11110 [Ignavibacteria bacterium]|nr:hypothetical protein [Ignavibacteria bacterium]